LISVEEKLARWCKEQGRGERVLGVYKGDKNVPLAQRRGGERVWGFPKALTHKIFPRNGEVNPTIRPNSLGIHPKFIGVWFYLIYDVGDLFNEDG
jgi:hypothetical protein